MGPGSGMGAGCDTVRLGGPFDTSEFALSTLPPSTSSIRRSTISVGDNHPAAAARRAKKKIPPPRESPGRDAKKKACDNITLLSAGRKQNPRVNRLPSRPPPRLRDFTPPPPIARPLVSDAHENSIATGATSDETDNLFSVGITSEALDNSFAAAETVAAAAAGGGGEVLSVDSSDYSSGDEESKESVPLFGAGLVDGSPTFSLDNEDQVADSPTDNEVSKYSFYQRLTHYMEGHKISDLNRAAVELCILSEAGAFVRNMDPMKKDIKERAFLAKYISIVDDIEDDQFVNETLVRDKMRRIYKGAKKEHTAQSLWRKYEQELTLLRTFAKKIPGIGNLAELPSGSTQLKHMKTPLVQSLWKEKNPVRIYFHLTFITITLFITHHNQNAVIRRTWMALITMIHSLFSRKSTTSGG
jgi:hypothetical protein